MSGQLEDTPRHTYAISENWYEVQRDMGHGGVRIGKEDLESVTTGPPWFMRCRHTSSATSMGPGILLNMNRM
jgi:hypothetical protein